MPTYSPKTAEIERAWHVVDADGMVLGRLATEVATISPVLEMMSLPAPASIPTAAASAVAVDSDVEAVGTVGFGYRLRFGSQWDFDVTAR